MTYEQESIIKENKHKTKSNTEKGKHQHINLSAIVCLYEQIIPVSIDKKSIL